MILGQLVHPSVAVQIDPAVTHGNPAQTIPNHQHRHQGGAALVQAVGAQHFVHGAVDPGEHFRQSDSGLTGGDIRHMVQRLHHDLLADLLAAGQTAHAIGNDGKDALAVHHGGHAVAVLLVSAGALTVNLGKVKACGPPLQRLGLGHCGYGIDPSAPPDSAGQDDNSNHIGGQKHNADQKQRQIQRPSGLQIRVLIVQAEQVNQFPCGASVRGHCGALGYQGSLSPIGSVLR